MGDIPNPYETKHKSSAGEVEQRLASYAAVWAVMFGVHFTDTERDALAKVLGAVLRTNPWILDIPGVKK